MTDGVVVLGMHRSGTSAITRGLNLLGASLGRKDDLHWASDNPEGHWESTALRECNDRILAAFGGTWFSPPSLDPGWELSSVASALLPLLRARFSEIYGASPRPWIWKDPRTCLTLPLWRRAFDEDIAVVLIVRAPAAVAKSLRRRNLLPLVYGLALWERYISSSLTSSRGLPLIFRRFESILEDPTQELERVVADLATLGVPLRNPAHEAATALNPAIPKGGRYPRWIDWLARPLLAEIGQIEGAYEDFRPTQPFVPGWSRLLLSQPAPALLTTHATAARRLP